MAIKTWFGGVCCVPSACLKIDKTIIIRVKAVIPRISEGRTVKAVISNSIWSDREYVVSPFDPVVVVSAGKPRALKSCATATPELLINIIAAIQIRKTKSNLIDLPFNRTNFIGHIKSHNSSRSIFW